MSRYIIASRAVCETTRARISKLLGYPREGVDIGSGRHVKHDKATGAGWTLHAYSIEVERDKDGELVKDGEIFTRVVDPDSEGDKGKLTAAELAYLRGKWVSAVALSDGDLETADKWNNGVEK